ncbi:EF-hand domain-containing family member C2-like isoform X2 [Bacillus rossius redtenbacheri]|uniref:EF-hand domain-containing family member C2-like isoform X2 n=1 Tax=Bacillus rossius redtenbacheri TaxID=93214 RepID=UPI002FDE8AFB
MLKNISLPLIPGYSFRNNVGQTRFHKSQHFELLRGTPVLADAFKPGIGGAPLPGSRPCKYPSVYVRGESQDLPPWIAFDKKVLCFDAFFQETVQELRYPYQIRKCKILFFLEDGTVQVVEPKVPNSGIPQGTIISRQRIPLPPPRDDQFRDILDFNVGREVELFGRVLKVVGCDRFTRVFLNRLGITVPDPLPVPPDPHSVAREKGEARAASGKPHGPKNALRQFLDHDRQVLSFSAYWDDRGTPHGLLHRLEKYASLPVPGSDSPFTVLNVMSGGFGKARYLPDVLNCGMDRTSYYRDNDLAIGAVLDVYGRKVTLTDCDAFTKEYYRSKYGMDDFTPLDQPAESLVEGPPPPRELPPYDGFGSYEDSAANCLSIIPVPPTRDFYKFLQKDRQGLDSHILRFKACMISDNPVDRTRQFIVCYYLCDDTMSVFEMGSENSGFRGGQMFSRERVEKPGQERYGSRTPAFYRPDDLFLGSVVVLHCFAFALRDADEYTLRYMELNCHEFPKSNIQLILSKLKEALRPIYKEFVSSYLHSETATCGTIPFTTFKEALKKIMCDQITDHEILTVGRRYRVETPREQHPRDELRSFVHTHMEKFLFKDLDRLQENLRYADACRSGFLPRATVYGLCRAARLPVDKQLLCAVLDKIDRNEAGELNYKDLMNFLDSRKCPPPPAMPYCSLEEFPIAGKVAPVIVEWMDLEALLKDLSLEETVTQQNG